MTPTPQYTPPPQPGSTPPAGPAQQPISIEQFAPPRQRHTAAIAITGTALALAVGLAGVVFLQQAPAPAPAPSTTTTGATPAQTATPTLPPMPTAMTQHTFATKNAAGSWQIREVSWQGSTVAVNVEVTVTSGVLNAQFMASPNSKGSYQPPLNRGKNPIMREGTIPAGTTATGWLTFAMTSRQTGTILLSDGNEIAGALEIEG